MPGIEDRSQRMNETRAFEYVSGTLRGVERQDFEVLLCKDESLQSEVRFWEEQLMTIQDPRGELKPFGSTWSEIETQINLAAVNPAKTKGWSLSIWKLSALSFGFAWIVALSIIFTQGIHIGPNRSLNANYVAVLTDATGAAKLTAHTSLDGKKLWLKWDGYSVKDEQSLQLWAQSRRDGQIRSLHVFDEDRQTLALNETSLRLIRDAAFLLLTEEETGGSAIDEPSALLIAKGLCIRLETKS